MMKLGVVGEADLVAEARMGREYGETERVAVLVRGEKGKVRGTVWRWRWRCKWNLEVSCMINEVKRCRPAKFNSPQIK